MIWGMKESEWESERKIEESELGRKLNGEEKDSEWGRER